MNEDQARQAMSPEAIVASATMTREQKIARLREMSYDAREMDVAKEEGMGGGPPSNLDRIQNALRALGADEPQPGTKH